MARMTIEPGCKILFGWLNCHQHRTASGSAVFYHNNSAAVGLTGGPHPWWQQMPPPPPLRPESHSRGADGPH